MSAALKMHGDWTARGDACEHGFELGDVANLAAIAPIDDILRQQVLSVSRSTPRNSAVTILPDGLRTE